MIVRFTTPSRLLGAWEATKLVAEGEHGSFCLKPRHIDWVAVLGIGISEVAIVPPSGQTGAQTNDAKAQEGEPTDIFVAHDSGVLVKKGDEVLVSVRRGVVSHDLDELRETVDEMFRKVDRQEQRARAAAGKLEVGFVRRFLELEESLGG